MPGLDNDRFYDEAIARYGYGAKGVHWRNEESQYRRFDILLQAINESIEQVGIVDAGCGSGALYRYLSQKKQLPKHYTGLEVKREFVAAAKELGCDIMQCNILEDRLPAADYYLCSGAMNILSREETLTFITRCFEASSKGFLFNLLEGSENESMLYNFWQPSEVKVMLSGTFDADFRIVKGYLKGDFTVYMRK